MDLLQYDGKYPLRDSDEQRSGCNCNNDRTCGDQNRIWFGPSAKKMIRNHNTATAFNTLSNKRFSCHDFDLLCRRSQNSLRTAAGDFLFERQSKTPQVVAKLIELIITSGNQDTYLVSLRLRRSSRAYDFRLLRNCSSRPLQDRRRKDGDRPVLWDDRCGQSL